MILNLKGWTGKRIRELRASSGMKQTEFADWLGVTPMHVSHLEQGVRAAGRQTVRLLALLTELRKSGQAKTVQRKGKGKQL